MKAILIRTLLIVVTPAMQFCRVEAQLEWRNFANLRIGRHHHVARYLPGDRVIVMGGYAESKGILSGTPVKSTEIIDLKTGDVIDGPTMSTARAEFPCVVLSDGDLLVLEDILEPRDRVQLSDLTFRP